MKLLYDFMFKGYKKCNKCFSRFLLKSLFDNCTLVIIAIFVAGFVGG